MDYLYSLFQLFPYVFEEISERSALIFCPTLGYRYINEIFPQPNIFYNFAEKDILFFLGHCFESRQKNFSRHTMCFHVPGLPM